MARPESTHYELPETERRDIIKLIEQGKPLAVKVIDIFGNDTMALIPVSVG